MPTVACNYQSSCLMLPNAGTSGMQCHTRPLKCGSMVSQCFQPIQTFRKELYRLLNISKLFWLVFCLWLSVSSVCAPFSQLQLKSRYRKRNTNQCVYAGICHKQKFHLPAGFPETLEHLCQGFLPLPQNRVERMGRDAEAQEGPKGEEDTRARFIKRRPREDEDHIEKFHNLSLPHSSPCPVSRTPCP